MKETEQKKQKTITQKAKRIRSIVMMTLLCVLMLSAATYAWFTLSKTSKISNLTMTVGDVTGLQIAVDKAAIGNETGPGTYGSELKFGATSGESSSYKITGKLLPATLVSKDNGIKQPEYATDGSGAVTGIKDVTSNEVLKNGSDADATGYYYETTFYLKSLGQDMNVRLKKGEKLAETGIQKATSEEIGTFVLNKYKADDTQSSTYIGAKAVRIWLSAVDADASNSDCGYIIYQPNSDLTADSNTYTTAEDKRGVTTEAPTDVQNVNGTFDKQGKLTLTKDHNNKVTMKIWIEGTDSFCGNEIKLEDIIAQLQFEEATTTTP